MTYVHIDKRTERNQVVNVVWNLTEKYVMIIRFVRYLLITFKDPELVRLSRREGGLGQDPRIHLTVGADKATVLRTMQRSSYFLYPLTLPLRFY
jgi:hypothetical protein